MPSENIYKQDYVKDLFNRMSGSYERMNYVTSFGFSLKWRRQFLQQINVSDKHVSVIDLMTGMGETWPTIKHKLPNAKISALDFSEKMLERASFRNQKRFGNEVLLLKHDVLNNPLPDNAYDYVFCAFGLKTFSDAQLKTLALEIKRILKPGGQFSFIEVSIPNNGLLKSCYKFYLQRIIPVLGKLMLGNVREYQMLWTYTQQFKNAQQAAAIFQEASLNVSYQQYFYGCATGFMGNKN